MENNRLPQFLKPTFWSNNLSDLDTEKDRAYIINQILAYGGMEELKWLFGTYTRQDIKMSFVTHPTKVYRPAAFRFAKDILLDVMDFLPVEKYVINTPRIIGQR